MEQLSYNTNKVKAYPIPKTTSYLFFMNTTDYDDRKSIFAPAAYFHTQIPRLAKEGGIQGYFYISPNAMRAYLTAPNSFANATKMRALLEPIITKIGLFPGMNKNTLFQIPPVDPVEAKPGKTPTPAQLTARYASEMSMQLPNGILNQDSRLLDEKAITSDKLADALEKSMPFDLEGGVLRQHIVSGPNLWAQGKDTSVHPAWRSAFIHSVASGAGTASVQALRDLTPGSGAYVNEVSYVYKMR
jgi:hypothetical protein